MEADQGKNLKKHSNKKLGNQTKLERHTKSNLHLLVECSERNSLQLIL